MKKPNGYWTLERVKEEVKQFTSMKEWRQKSNSSYVTAAKKDWIAELSQSLAQERHKVDENLIKERTVGKSFSFIEGTFQSVHKPARWLCHKCNAEFSSRVNHVLYHDIGCKKCATKEVTEKSRRSLEEVITTLRSKDIALLNSEQYKGGNHKTTFVCLKNSSHKPWTTMLYSIMNPSSNTGCPECTHTIPITIDTVLNGLVGKKIELVEFTSGAHRKSLFKCLENSNHPNWKTTNASIYALNTGCPACAEYGFNGAKPAYLYCVPLHHRVFGDVFGFGITNNGEQRWKTHKMNLKRNGFSWETPFTLYKNRGIEAREIETTIKNHIRDSKSQINWGVEGFTTEAFEASAYDFVIKFFQT